MKKGSAEVATSDTDAQRDNKYKLCLVQYKFFGVHCALQISVRMLACVIIFLNAMITIRERLLSWKWCR